LFGKIRTEDPEYGESSANYQSITTLNRKDQTLANPRGLNLNVQMSVYLISTIHLKNYNACKDSNEYLSMYNERNVNISKDRVETNCNRARKSSRVNI
jgi:hypothetical protein